MIVVVVVSVLVVAVVNLVVVAVKSANLYNQLSFLTFFNVK